MSLIQLSFSAATIAAHFNAQQCVWLLFIRTGTYTHTLPHLHVHTCSIDRRHATCNKDHYRMQISRYSFLFSCCAQHLISLRAEEKRSQGVCLDLHFHFLVSIIRGKYWVHRLWTILCLTTDNFKQKLLRHKPRGKHSNCLTEQFQLFLDFPLPFFAAAAALRGRLLAVFPAVVDSSPSSFSIIPGQAVDATGTQRGEEGDSTVLWPGPEACRCRCLSICSLHRQFSFSHHQAALVAICYKSSIAIVAATATVATTTTTTGAATTHRWKQTEIELLMANVKKSTNLLTFSRCLPPSLSRFSRISCCNFR